MLKSIPMAARRCSAGTYQVPDAFSSTGFNEVSNAYVYDRASDTTRLLSNPANSDTPFTVNDPVGIGGNFIVFSSSDFGNFFGPPVRHLYVTDLAGNILTDATMGTFGITEPSDPSDPQTEFQQPQISADGRYVTFWTAANSFDPNTHTNTPVGDATLHIYDRIGGTSQIIATTTNSDSESWPASLSDDGRYVVFQSDKDSLDVQVGGVANHHIDVFVFDRLANSGAGGIIGITDSAGLHGNGDSERASISPDGRYVVLASYATNLVSGDTNGQGDSFVYDLQTHTFQRISVASDGSQANGDSTLGADISANGTVAVFGSVASNLVSPVVTDGGASDIFVVDRAAGAGTATGTATGSITEMGTPSGNLSTTGTLQCH